MDNKSKILISQHGENNPIMYIFVNEDLKMTTGKTIAQCCHLVYLITEYLA